MVLGLIIVGITLGLSNQLFDSHAEDSNKDSIASEFVNLSTMAEPFFNKPAEMGGGNQSFINWVIPAELDSSTSGIYEFATVINKSMVISGTSSPQSGYSWYLQSTITKTVIETEVMLL